MTPAETQPDRRGRLPSKRPILRETSIVIPTLGRSILRKCLQSIAQGNAWPAELIVVDQSSSPEVEGWIAQLRSLGMPARHLPSTQRGRAAAVNRGVEAATTAFVAVTDDDCTVEQHWLERLTTRLLEDPGRIVTGRVEAAGEQEISFVVTSRVESVCRRPGLTFDNLSGGNVAIPRSVFDRVGLLDEDPRLRCAEDGEFAYRALRGGFSILYDPEAIVWHHGWRNAVERAAQLRAYARSHGAFYGKYLRRGDAFIALRAIVHQARAARRWMRGLLRGDREKSMIGRAYFLGLVPGILSGLSQSRASSGPTESSTESQSVD